MRWMVFAVVLGSACDVGEAPLVDAPVRIDSVIEPGFLAVDSQSLDLGSVPIGEAQRSEVAIINVGIPVTGLIESSIEGTNAGAFSVTDTCVVLVGGEQCTATVTFAPMTTGAASAMLVVTSRDGEHVTVLLTGTGTTSEGIQVVGPSSFTFTEVGVGAASAQTATFEITQAGAGETGPLTVMAGGDAPGDFEIRSNTCTTLAGGASCTIDVGFVPTATGARAAVLTVAGNPGGSVNLAVSGTGTAPGPLVPSRTQVDFGSIGAGASSTAVDVMFTNIGPVPTGVLSENIAGANAAEFAVVSSTCAGATLTSGASCIASLKFQPQTTGSKAASLRMQPGTGAPVVVSLSGTGVTDGGGFLTASPSIVDLGAEKLGDTSPPQTVTVTNAGAGTTAALAIALSGVDASQFHVVAATDTCTGVTLAGAAACTFEVVFAPLGSVGAKTATATVSATPGGTVSVVLVGTSLSAARVSR